MFLLFKQLKLSLFLVQVSRLHTPTLCKLSAKTRKVNKISKHWQLIENKHPGEIFAAGLWHQPVNIVVATPRSPWQWHSGGASVICCYRGQQIHQSKRGKRVRTAQLSPADPKVKPHIDRKWGAMGFISVQRHQTALLFSAGLGLFIWSQTVSHLNDWTYSIEIIRAWN